MNSRLHLVVLFALFPLHNAKAEEAQAEFFEKRIRPILVEHCYDCHGAEQASGKLRLHTKGGWRRGGESGPAIVPGDPSSSLLFRAVTFADKKLRMPPPEDAEKLTAQQISDLERWIRQGAFDPREGEVARTPIDLAAQKHWAFQPITPPVIDVKAGLHPIDALVNGRLRSADFVATPPAERSALIRRATYDLHGLPPTKEQLATSREDFPQLVRQLLASPRYGERWARHWLDVARYSDAKDGVLMYGDARIRPFAYTYRDYVIRAFNDDKPFDQFIREQLAADQLDLPENSPNLAAMGLLTLGRMFDRNPHDVIDDQIDVVTRGFLGLTVSCSRCHDHKFDPVPTADYYSLYGVFASSVQPYRRPRIEPVGETGKAYEEEVTKKLEEVFATRQRHYQQTLATARDRTPDYLVQVATTEPDISETSIFFLSLLPDQLRPQITYRWRKLIARRAYPDDRVFGPWHDLMKEPKLQVDQWRRRGVDPRIIAGLAAANPQTPQQVARVYGEIIRGVWDRQKELKDQIDKIQGELDSSSEGDLNLADVVAGGNGFGAGVKGGGIHPDTGKPTTGQAGFIPIKRHDVLIPATDNPFVDGVFVPKTGDCTISSTGIKISGLKPTEGKTWDYFKAGPSSGSTSNAIDEVDYSQKPHFTLALHANKGITFDLQAFRDKHDFESARFKTLFGHGGAKGQSRLDFAIYLDGRRVLEVSDFKAQQKGHPVDIELTASTRFLTLIVTEGGQGISHDQAILGDPRIAPDKTPQSIEARRRRRQSLTQQQAELKAKLANLDSLEGDPLADLLLSNQSPVWFPINKIYYYLSRQQKDAFRGLVNQLDGISVKHKSAAGRAMVMVDSESLYEPVIFQRGDPTMPGPRVPRRFLKAASSHERTPFRRGSGRLDLADAIASPTNPLTARVWVNRIWMHHFGEPIVENPSDFGLRTKRPVQHELLDYLASELIEGGWRPKRLHLLIMTSQTYQRSSQLPDSPQMAKQLESDPNNRYLWRANRRRLDLEQMRDTMLALAGKIDFTMYGRPPLITDANNNRRTVYAFVERQNLPNIVQTFDFANADTSTARRVTTTVPQQALHAMNSAFMTEMAKSVAARAGDGDDRQRITKLYDLVLGRAPSDDELELGSRFVETNPWSQFAQVLLLTNELMFVD